MSSADPGPPAPRAPRVAYVLAVLLPVLLLAVLAVPVGLVWVYHRSSSSPAPALSSSSPAPLPGGQRGLGDPYYPNAGNSGYDVAKYTIDLDFDPGRQFLRGRTTIEATATSRLASFFLDFGLHVDQIIVNGRPAQFTAEDLDVKVQPAQPLPVGSPFTVEVEYGGRPGNIRPGEFSPWLAAGDEWIAAGEPEAAAWWFPSNDHPSDPALMDTSIRVPAGFQAISTGRLASRDSRHEADFDTWHWISDQPMATYLNFVSIGHYSLKQGVDGGRPYVYAVSDQLSAADRKEAMATLMSTGARVRTLERLFGPYPFTELGGIVTVEHLDFDGLEAQTRPVYRAEAILDRRYAADLLNHELTHMWFGDNVTVRQWNDIFDNEAWASWAQWGCAELAGGPSANSRLDATYDRVRGNAQFWRITMTDPGRDHLFDAVYTRGPMALQALRNLIGDDAFFGLARDWAQRPGSRSLEDWMAFAQTKTPTDLRPFFQAWLFAPTAPARTAANGFRS